MQTSLDSQQLLSLLWTPKIVRRLNDLFAVVTKPTASEQTLLNLHAIFGSTLQAAMELVDRGEGAQISSYITMH